MKIHFTKMQGVGNDFVVVDGRGQEVDWPAFAIAACRRRTGIGADGLLVLEDSGVADLKMRMFNPDGSPDVCGNGLRCVARYAVERQWAQSPDLKIEALDGVRTARYLSTRDGAFNAISIDMGKPRFTPEQIPVRAESERVIAYPLELPDGTILSVTALSTGSAHAVTFVEELPDDARFFALSPEVERHPLFPERTSLMWCQITDTNRIAMRIWERGAGETWGCGTGACAAAVASIIEGRVAGAQPIIVGSRGGELMIQWQNGDRIRMTGPANFVFEGIWYDSAPMSTV